MMFLLASLVILSMDFVHTENFNYLCNSRSLIAGAGYNSHPRECGKYIQCHWDVNGNYVAEVRQCAFGTHWNMAFHTCLRSTETTCVVDECTKKADGTVRAGVGNCRGYWECSAGRSVSKCCPRGQFYSVTHGCTNITALVNCTDRCFDDSNLHESHDVSVRTRTGTSAGCDKRAIPGSPSKFEQLLSGYSWKIVRLCSLGTQFVQEACNCLQSATYQSVNRQIQANASTQMPVRHVKPVSENLAPKPCTPALHLPFTINHKDVSENKIAVGNENVIVEDGVAKFNGINSRLIIGDFSRLEPTDRLVVKIRYSSDHENIPVSASRVLFSNDNCHFKPSIVLSESGQTVEASVGTWTSSSTTVGVPLTFSPTDHPQLGKAVVYKLYDGRLSVQVGNRSASVPVIGHIRNIRCPLHIGYADGLKSFKGVIDEIVVYLCDPDTA